MKATVLNHLQTEHRCLLSQAGRIQRRLDQIREGSPPDYAALAERTRLLRDHYVGVHAPKDSAVVDKLARGSHGLENILTPFLSAHAAAFLEHLEEFEAGLQAVLCEHPVPRERLVSRGEAALRHLRQQIDTEETATFPWARRRLAESDWSDIAASEPDSARDWAGAGCEAAGTARPSDARRPA